MGSKKHKKHKSERKERHEDRYSSDRPPSLKVILKLASGSSSTPEHIDSPSYGIQSDSAAGLFTNEYSEERHKKSKKKKKKKDREKKHKHHKEKKRHREDSSQEDLSLCEEPSESSLLFSTGLTTTNSPASVPVTKPFTPIRSPTPEPPPVIVVSPEPVEELLKPIEIDEEKPIVVDPNLLTPPQNLELNDFTMKDDSSPSKLESGEHTPKSIGEPRTPSSGDSGREPRTCVLKLKQSRGPLTKLLEHLIKSLEKRDPHQFFAWPVTDQIAPGYSTIIIKGMDFSTMRQKIEDNEYNTLPEFSDDFKLMCENAIKYNHSETVYHKSAKKLLHVGARILQPENLIRSLRPLMVYMRELSTKELGFDLSAVDGQDTDHNLDSADEAISAAQEEEDEKRRQIRLENNPETKFEAFMDDLMPDEILQQVQNAAKIAKSKLSKRKNAQQMGFLRQRRDGTTTMKILVDNDNDGPEKVINLGAFTGKLKQGTGQLHSFREDRRNTAKMVKPLNYGAFSSFAPIFDSRFSNLSKEESDLILRTYGDETGMQYAESLIEFSKDSPYASIMVNSLLDVLTAGEHRKSMGGLLETKRQKHEEVEVRRSFPDPDHPDTYKHVKIDFNHLKSLQELGIDVDFLDEIEDTMHVLEMHKKIQEHLKSNSSLIDQLHQMQNERLSAPLPVHLSHVQQPNQSELQLASQITSNLTDLAKQLPPIAISAPHSLRKAMGLSNAGLENFVPPQHVMITNRQPQSRGSARTDIDTTPIDMDLEPEENNDSNPPQVDIDIELRELLESQSGPPGGDTSGIEQMLLD